MKNKFNLKWKIIIIFVISSIVISSIVITSFIGFKIFVQNSKQDSIQADSQDNTTTQTSNNTINNYYSLIDDSSLNAEEDRDADGLTNGEEDKLKSSPYALDTDGDGISDYLEVTKYKTDPLVMDTDSDGVTDGDELSFGLDPLNKSSDKSSLDIDRIFDKNYTYEQCSLALKGNASIGQAIIQTFNTSGLSNYPGIVGNFYELYTGGTFTSASISIGYTEKDLKTYSEDNLSIFQFTDDGKFIKVESVLNKENNTLSAELKHFSKYVIGDISVLDTPVNTQIMLVIDDSGSMYNTDYMNKIFVRMGSEPELTTPQNDVDFKRVDMAKKLIELSDNSVTFGLGTFTLNYKSLSEMGDSKENITAKLDAIKTAQDQFFDGTGIATAINSALASFKDNSSSHKNFLVLLSDGKTTEDSISTTQLNAIKLAKEKNVTIIVIALGQDVDSDYLTKYVTETGGVYIYANNTNDLDDAYKKIFSVIDYDYTDSNNDKIADEILLADSGFKIGVNSLKYANFCTLTGQKGEFTEFGNCFGISALTTGYYNGTLKTKMSDSAELKPSITKGAGKELGYTFKYFSFVYSNNNISLGKNFIDYKQNTLDAIELVAKLSTNERYDLKDKTLSYSDKAKEIINKSKFLKISMTEFDKTNTISETDKRDYNKAENLVVDISTIKQESLTESEKDEYEFFSTTARLHISQLENTVMQKYDLNDASFKDTLFTKSNRCVKTKL